MNKIIYSLKVLLCPVMIAGFLGFCNNNASAQVTGTGTCKVLHQPCNGYDGELVATVTSGLTPPLTFQYSGGGISGVTNTSVTHSNVNSLTDTLKGTEGCTYVYVSDNFQHYAYITNTGMVQPFNIDYPTITPAICPAITGTIKITINKATLMPDTVKWYQNVNGVPVNYLGAGDPMTLPVGTYIALIVSNGCRIYTQSPRSPWDSTQSGNYNSGLTIPITSNIKLTTTTTAANCTNGTATVSSVTGGVAPYTYHWSNGAMTPKINNLSMGYYLATVTDAQGCSAYIGSYTVYVSQATEIILHPTITQPTCLQNNGSVQTFASGGLPPYTFLYSNGAKGPNVNSLSGGAYLTVYATDANGCKGQSGAYLQSTTPITVTYLTTPSSCTSATGSATLNISGGKGTYTVEWNASPLQTGVTINNMNPGTIGFKVTDSVGCVQTGKVIIPPVSNISASIAADNAVCPAKTGAVYTNAIGDNPPFTFLWNTGATTQSISNTSTGSYNCTITDKVGCSVIKYTSVNIVSTVNVSLNPTSATCLYASDGSILANAYGGVFPYTYTWSIGQKVNPATGLSKGNYYVYATDANGCTNNNRNNYAYVDYDKNNDSCYCTIQGKVYLDENNNCQLDGGEQGVQHIMISCSGIGYTFTDANGDYKFLVPTGTYNISEIVQSFYPLASCQKSIDTVTVTASHACTTTFDFANIINPLHDISIVTTNINQAVSGYSYVQELIVQNEGTITENNIQLEYEHDGQLKYSSTSPNVYTQPDATNSPNFYAAYSGFPSLSPGASVTLLTYYHVPVNVPLGTAINFKDTAAYASPMSNWLADYTPWNNINSFQTTVLGSFDPNFIEVLPQGLDTPGYIHNKDSVLTYTIHFQNIGSYYARNIVLTDTLDKNLEINTIKPGYSDHNYTANVSETGVLTFTFQDIYLTWKSLSDLGSRSLVTFSVKHKPNLELGTKIQNEASIYFDFNKPVVTNKALNTIADRAVGVTEIKQSKWLAVYPNPTTGDLFVKVSNGDKSGRLNIYDLTGRSLMSKELGAGSKESIYKMDVSSLTNGIYFIQLLNANKEKSTVKFIKE